MSGNAAPGEPESSATPSLAVAGGSRLLGGLWDGFLRRALLVSAWFFRGRYVLLSSVFGLQPEGDDSSPRGTLFVEIDGLGYGHLMRAIERGYMPFTRRLLRSGQFMGYRWRCGLAADTPPIQSGLFYGTSEGVVGFYWWDRQAQKRVVGANPLDMRRVEAELARRAGHPGLLVGGSSYSNIMSGGARYSVLTIAGSNTHWYQPGVALLRALTILSLNPGKTVRFIFDALWEMVLEMEDRAFVNAMDRPRVQEGAFPIVRVLLNVLAREIVTAGARLDLLRGVPVIYACYIGYDIVGHHSGPLSRNSLRVLRGIDGAIRKLYETRGWAERKYNLILLSDHGMTPCQPAAEAFDSDFHEWVEQWWRHGAQATPRFRTERRRYRRRLRRRVRRHGQSWVSRIAGGVARRSSGWLRTWGRIGAWTLELGSAGALKLGERFLEQEEDPNTPRVAVISCGPLSQVWVKEVAQRIDLDEVERLCPGFLQAAVDHPAVEVVIGVQDGLIEVRGRSGTIILRPTASPEEGKGADPQRPARTHDPVVGIEGENPLLQYEEPDVVARQIASFAAMQGCGDVICFASLFQPESLRDATPGAIGEPHVYSFEHQLGTHASVGGDQSYPFVILPARIGFDPQPIISAADLHSFLLPLVRKGNPDRISQQ